jgi:hypothetical protein
MANNIFKRMGQYWDHLVNGKQGETVFSSKPFYVDPMKPVNLMASDENSETDEWLDETRDNFFTSPKYSFSRCNIFNTDTD